MKKILPIVLCLVLFSCKQETIPVVSVTTLPAELVGLGKDTLFDSIPYQIEQITLDTITPDSIVSDTLVIDTFRVDTFYVDTIRLCANIAYEGNEPFGPALQEYGFCINENIDYPIYQSDDLQTPDSIYAPPASSAGCNAASASPTSTPAKKDFCPKICIYQIFCVILQPKRFGNL